MLICRYLDKFKTAADHRIGGCLIYLIALRISEASSSTRWGLSGDCSRISRVVSPERTRMPVMPAFRPDFTSV